MELSSLWRAVLTFGLWLGMLLILWLAPLDLKVIAIIPALALAFLMARPLWMLLSEAIAVDIGLFGLLVFAVLLFLTALLVAPLFGLWQLYRHFAGR